MWDPMYWLFIAPALILGLWAQMRIRWTYSAAQQMPAPLSGAAAARHILDSAGLGNVAIEMVPGHLSDHYDPRDKVLRLSEEVYQSRSLAAVGIAAHESGHALQDARAKAVLVDMGIISRDELYYVKKVLNAAALTYVAATLQAILTLLYLILRFGNRD
jgi:Zn-dependent membrane protease YugP